MSNKKIWSVPIAVLALALMLAGAMAVSGIVQAQTEVNRVISVGGTTQAKGALSYTYPVSGDDALADDSDIATVTIPGSVTDVPGTPFDESTGLKTESGTRGAAEFVPPEDIASVAGYELTGTDAGLFDVSDAGVIGVGTGHSATLNKVDGKAVFNFNLKIYIDKDTGFDSGMGKTIADATNGNKTPDSKADTTAADGDAAGDEDTPARPTDNGDDRDEVVTIPITVRVLKVAQDADADANNDVFFALIPGKSVSGDLLTSTDGNSKGVRLNGLAGAMKVVGVTDGDASDDSDDDTTDSGVDGGVYGDEDAQNVVWLKYGTGGAEETPDPANDLLDDTTDLIVDEFIRVTFTVQIDTDTTTDTATDTDTDPANDVDVEVPFTANIALFNVLGFWSGTTDDDGTDVDESQAPDKYTFAIRSNASSGDKVGSIPIMGAASTEAIDVLLNGANGSDFNAAVSDDRMNVNITASRDFTQADRGTKSFVVAINGKASKTRTAETRAEVLVTLANERPEVVGETGTNAMGVKYTVTMDDDGKKMLTLTVPEQDMGEDNLLDDMTGTGSSMTENVLFDFGMVVDDAGTPDDRLTYMLSGPGAANDFALKEMNSKKTSMLIPAIDIAASEENEAASSDDDDTDGIDESMKYYERPADDGGMFGAMADMSRTNDKFADITYTMTLTVSDAANTVSLPVKLVVVPNKPVSVSETEKTGTYVSTDPFGELIINIRALIDVGNETGDEIEYEMDLDEVAPFSINDAGEIKITFPGRIYSEVFTWTGTVTINDNFINTPVTESTTDPADARDPDATVMVTITSEQGDPPERHHVEVTIKENHALGFEVVNLKTHDTLEGDFTDAEKYKVVGGDGEDVFSILDAATGVVTLNSDADIDVDAAGADDSYLLSVSVTGANNVNLGEISLVIGVEGVNEAPMFAGPPTAAHVSEDAQDGDAVMTGAGENAAPLVFAAADVDGDGVTYSIAEQTASNDFPFAIGRTSGAVTVVGDNALEYATKTEYAARITATDPDGLTATHDVTIEVVDENDAPFFVYNSDHANARARLPEGDPTLTIEIAEDTRVSTEIADFDADDPDGSQGLVFSLKNQDDTDHFTLGELSGVLSLKSSLDYETQRVHLVEINVTDPDEATAEVQLTVNVLNVNDSAPAWDSAPVTALTVLENTVRGTTLSNYSATDDDGQVVTYSLGGSNADSFSIDTSGNLKTLESLDADRQVPCGAAGCSVTVIATDVANGAVIERAKQRDERVNVRITVTPAPDSVSTLDVSKANPVPGTEMGVPLSALSNAKTGGDEYLWNMLDCAGMLKLVGEDPAEANSDPATTAKTAYCKMWDGLSDAAKKKVSDALDRNAPAESPYDLPATEGSSPMNFVETEWANWDTVLRIEVTAESPDANCGNGNQCVVISVNSDSADDVLKLQAYRVDTPAGSASRENHYVAALKLVEMSNDATPDLKDADGKLIKDGSVFEHPGGGVAALKVDEEDEVEIEFGNLRDTIDVENEAPEVSNFAPEHERAFDDADVDYTFTITDDNSGLPEPEDLPDADGDADYTPVVALISKDAGGAGQCWVSKDAPKDADGKVIKGLSVAAHIHEDDTLYCPGTAQTGEYVASKGGFGFAPIRDDKDFDETGSGNGYDVETTIVLTENDTYYVTFIVCDNAGNCAYYDPDGNDDGEELAQITVDTEDPVFVEARTGLKWDSTDNEYDDDRNYIQVIFNDLTTLNAATVEMDDFVVEGHTIKSVTVYENPDEEDVDWADSDRYAQGGSNNKRHMNEYRDLENVVFIELEDELLADETPDVTIVPNGVEDAAGNEQDDGDHEADDWISPRFTIVSITSTLETAQDEVLAGDGDEITLVVTADERLDATRPTVEVTYVKAANGSVDTKGTAACKNADDPDDKVKWTGTRDRGEIVNGDNCQNIAAAKGGRLNNSVEKVSNTEWIVTVTEPKDTGYYNFRIEGQDRSPQENPGSEGIDEDKIVVDFFDSDGDVNIDDAVFWEGDINLSNPNVRVSGNVITDNEPDIEFRSPLFVEIDFTRNHWSEVDCKGEDKDSALANCMNENSEYAEDNFDDIVITMFELDGVDMTDSVKTTDAQTFLITLESVALGDHTARIQATDVAGNTLEDVLEIDFEVSDRDPFERRLNPGWNLVSLPGEPADSAIGSVFGAGVEVRTVYTYDPVVPGGWMVAVRETLDSDWQGDLTEITGSRGYWVLSDAIQDWEVSIPRLAGGAAGTGTPIQPPVIALYAGWNLIPVTDISGNGEGGQTVSADVYLQNLDDGLDLARVLGFDTIRNQWVTVLDPDMQMNNTLRIGDAYWIFVREAASLVPSGYTGGGGSD